MIKLMIVDDEAGIRAGLKYCIEWDVWDIQFVGEASDGETAYQLALETQPDIVLTDIRMPKMDGLELSRHLKAHFPTIRIILLTGFTETEYLRSALEIGVTAYLVKPAGAEEAIEAVLKQKQEILRERRRHEHNLMRDALLEENLTVLQMHFFNNMSGDAPLRIDALRRKAATLRIPLDGPVYQFVMISISQTESYETTPQYEQDIDRWHTIRLLNEITEEIPGSFYCELDLLEFLFLINANNTQEAEAAHRLLCRRISEKYHIAGCRPLIGIGMPVTRCDQLRLSFLSARMSVWRSVWDKEESIFYGPDEEGTRRFQRQPPSAHKIEKDIITQIMLNHPEEARQSLDCLFDCYYEAYSNFDLLREACKRIVIYVPHPEGGTEDERMRTERLWNAIDHAESANALKALMISCINRQPSEDTNYSGILNKAIQYMEKHYAENITLQTLAKEIFLSPGHLSLIFRRETGMKVGDWLNRYRIEQAKLLLTHENVPINEIAERVGFSSYKYFSMYFLKYTHMNARTYRIRAGGGSDPGEP